jgi:hypothetical protein
MSSPYEDYDDMPNLEQTIPTQQAAATPIVASITQGGPPSTNPEAATGAITTPTAHDDQNIGSAPISAIHTPWGSVIPLPATGPIVNMYAGAGLNQDDPSALPPHPFLLFAQALGALGSPLDSEAGVIPPDDPTLSTEPNDLLAGFTAMLSAPPGVHDDAEDDDAWEDESGDEHDDMPSLETAVPTTNPLPSAVEGAFQDVLTSYMANIFGALGPVQTATGGAQNGSNDQSSPVAPPSSALLASPALSTTTTSQNGSGGVPDPSATAMSDQNPQNGPATGQPTPLHPFQCCRSALSLVHHLRLGPMVHSSTQQVLHITQSQHRLRS